MVELFNWETIWEGLKVVYFIVILIILINIAYNIETFANSR